MSTPESDYDTPLPEYHTPPALIAFTLSVLILCFVAFSIVCICKYCFTSTVDTWAFQRTASGSIIHLPPDRSLPRGLDPALLEGFPTFLYACVKDHRKEKSYSLECAICLLEFEDDSLIRLLTICCHVFHKECIDLWLHSHKTCPVCRTELDSLPPKNPMPKYSSCEDNINHNAQKGMVSSTSNDICIDVRERDGDDGVGDRVGDQRHEHEQRDHHMSMQQEEQKFARSHSTGHSIVLIRGGGEEKDDDKYTLRLPEHVIRGGNYYCSRGCASCRDNCGFVQPVSDGSSSVAHAQES